MRYEMLVTGDTTIEELVTQVPTSVKYLMAKGIVCIMCGEPVWGTLAEVARTRGYDDAGIAQLAEELTALASDAAS